jgi:hypothetical protein
MYMKTGKILTAIFIIGLLFVLPVTAQEDSRTEWTKENLQDMYMQYLRTEGYLPSVDEDGDIIFKVSGANYYIIIDENDLQFFQIYRGLKLPAVDAEAAINAANFSNRHSKVAKVWISSDGSSVSINTELLLGNPNDFASVFTRALSVIRNAERNFFSQIESL